MGQVSESSDESSAVITSATAYSEFKTHQFMAVSLKSADFRA
ncbi:MAG: hypothetical protein RSD35_01485 [Oscillospiraceae bacterium]